MKKLVLFITAIFIVLVLTIPPSYAIDTVFGGYLRTRAFTNQNFDGNKDPETFSDIPDLTIVDMRTRLYFTAVLNDNLKFVNRFEFDAVWGKDAKDGANGADGDFGTDGAGVEIKHSYAEVTKGPFSAIIGLQPIVISRGFLFDDDFAGAVLAYNADNFTLPFIWMKAYEGGGGFNGRDVDFFAVAPSFSIQDKFAVTPYFLYAYSNNAQSWKPTELFEDLRVYYAGMDIDVTLDTISLWLTGIYMGGSADLASDSTLSLDFKAWLAAAGFGVDIGQFNIHGRGFYASGDDPEKDEFGTFFVPSPDGTGQSYYWAEIMGYGIFDECVSKGSPADKIGNIMAGNIGFTFKPIDKLSISLDGWYARLVEDVEIAGEKENELGTEVDLTISYQLLDRLMIDVVGAYLFAGNVTTAKSPDEKDPYELGVQLSLEF